MAIPVKLEVFEGPLDLLLHLIEKNKINIYDIPILDITNQYLEYIEQLKHADMNITSEFMVMAAELIDIKCRMLLPKEEEDEEEEDPREELVRRLLEYKMYKNMAFELREMLDETNGVYREPSIPEEVKAYRPKSDPTELLSDVSLVKLHEIFRDILKRQQDLIDPIRSDFGRVYKEDVKLQDKVKELADFAKTHTRFSFRELMGSQRSRTHTIVMFLAVLEFMKNGLIKTSQKKVFDDIEIETVEGSDFNNIEIEVTDDEF